MCQIGALKGKDDVALRRQLQRSVDAMLSDIVSTHTEKQRELTDASRKFERRTAELKTRCDRLSSGFKMLYDQLVDNGLEPVVGENADMDEDGGGANGAGGEGTTSAAGMRRMRMQVQTLRRDVRGLQDKLLTDAEAHRTIVANLHTAHAHILEDLKGGLEQKLALTKDEQQRHIVTQSKIIADLRSTALKDDPSELKRQIVVFNAENAQLRKLLKERPIEVEVASADGVGGDGMSEDFEMLRKLVKDFTSTTQTDLERERSQLLVRASTAEEELSQVQAYITKSLTDYTSEIQRLRTKVGIVDGAKATAAATGAPASKAAFSKYGSLSSLQPRAS